MYNKLFTKILDSSIWLAPDPHRLVWITLIAAMNRHGIAEFACIANLAARARVSIPDTESAVTAFEAPDPYAPWQEYEGRRLERVEGGWLILNAEKYAKLAHRIIDGEQARVRMQRKRDNDKLLRNVTESSQSSPSDHTQTISNHQNQNARASEQPVDKSAHERAPESLKTVSETLSKIRSKIGTRSA